MNPVALFNDTGRWPHVGCRAVSDGHDRMLARAGFTVTLRAYHGEWGSLVSRLRTCRRQAERALRAQLAPRPLVIVNGEGTLHHGGGRALLAVLRGAQAWGCRTALVNAVVQALDPDAWPVLARLTRCTVRDAASSAYLTAHGIAHQVVSDALLEADFVSDPVCDLAGRIIVTDWHGSRAGDVGAACQAFLAHLGAEAVFYPLEDAARAAAWRHTVADWRPARLVITARHHGVYLAALAGVPFLALGSNTWKIEGLLARLPGGPPCLTPAALRGGWSAAARGAAAWTGAIQAWMHAQCPLPTFEGLAA